MPIEIYTRILENEVVFKRASPNNIRIVGDFANYELDGFMIQISSEYRSINVQGEEKVFFTASRDTPMGGHTILNMSDEWDFEKLNGKEWPPEIYFDNTTKIVYFNSPRAGGRKKGTNASKKHESYTRTTQKIKCKDGVTRTVYTHPKTGQAHVRKQVTRNGKKTLAYVKP